MLRRLVTLVVQFAVLAALAAPVTALAAATHRTDVVQRLGSRLDTARATSGIAVLVPSHLDTEFKRLYPGGGASRGHYHLDLGAVRRCHEATACFVAAFLGDRRATVSTGRRVALARGHTGRFAPSACGASCSAPQVQWRQGGVLYTIQATQGGTGGTDRARLVSLANQAIRAGAR